MVTRHSPTVQSSFAVVRRTDRAHTGPPRKVLLLDHTATLSGGELALYDLVTHLDAARFQPSVVLFSEGNLVERLHSARIPTHLLLLSENVVKIRKDTLGANTLLRLGDAVRTLQFVFRLARFIRQQQPDIVHTNSLKSDIIGGLAGRLARRPVLWHVRDRIEPDYLPRPIVTLFRRLCRILPHYIIANSAATLDTLHLPPGKSQGTVYSGVDYKEFAQAQPAEEIVAIPSPRIGLVGRITPWKGQHIFLQAAAKLNLEFPGAQFVIVGGALFAEKEYEQEIKTLTNRLGLSHCVHFTGFRTDVARWIAGLDILAHASTSGEPFGQVIVQGMAAGKPVVATCGGGIPEIVVDGETGLLVPMNDAEALSQAIAALLRDPERARCMGERGQERVLEHFTIERTTRAMEEVYDAMLHHSKRA